MKKLQTCYKIIRYFIGKIQFLGQNSNVHGLKGIFEKGTNIFSRIFWLGILLASSGCLYLLLKPVLVGKNHISFTPDTLYIDWTTTFPAVTVCEAYNSKMAQRKLAELYPNLTQDLNFDYRRYITDLAYGRGSCSRSVCNPCGDKIPCDVPWSNIVRDVHLTCVDLLSTCNFNTENFTCCKEFLSVDSEYGPCYTVNSLQSKKLGRKKFVVNRKTGPGVLSFRLLSDAQISIHSTEELSTNVLDTKFKFDIRTQIEDRVDILFSLIEIENEPMVRLEDINVRKCRYSDEIFQEHLYIYPVNLWNYKSDNKNSFCIWQICYCEGFKVYSYGACRLVRNTEQSLKYCGCIHPVRDKSYTDKYCNFTGLNCLVTYEAHKTKLGTDTVSDLDDCWPSCEESELTIIHVSRRLESKYRREGVLVNVIMSSLPTMRYQKTLLRSNLDVVVSVGGMIGLFFGASILSVAEAIYLFYRSPTSSSR